MSRHHQDGKDDGPWLVYYSTGINDHDTLAPDKRFVSADVVILAAGALGSTQILLASQLEGLQLSAKLGHGYSGNGDHVGISYINDEVGRRFRCLKSFSGPLLIIINKRYCENTLNS